MYDNRGRALAAFVTRALTVQSDRALAVYDGSLSISSGTLRVSNTNGITFGISGQTLTASHNGITQSPAVSASNGSFTFQTLTMADSNGLSWSTGSQGIFGSHNALTSQSNQALSGANGSFTFQTATFANSNGVSFSTGTQGLYATVATSYRVSNDAVGLNTAQTNVTWTVNSAGLSLNASGYAGTATAATNASLTVNSNGVSISVNAGGAGNTVSYYANLAEIQATSTLTVSNSISAMVPFSVDQNLSFGSIRFVASESLGGASTTQATTGNTSLSFGSSKSYNFVIYSRGVDASSASLQYVTSTQVVDVCRLTVSYAANSTQHSYSLRYTIGSQSFTKDYSLSVNSVQYHTSHLTDLSGWKLVDMPFAGSLAPGQYWLASGVTTATATQANSISNASKLPVMLHTVLGVSQHTIVLGRLGGNTNSSVMHADAMGSFSTGGAAGTTSSVEMTRVSSVASNFLPYFQLLRIT
jgi:hypothetical protein